MGTRGALGVRLGGHDKIAYNHFDSYPEGLGHDTINALHELLKTRPHTEAQIKVLAAIPEDDKGNKTPPTPEQIERLKKYSDTGVGNQDLKDWYCLLRRAQGDLAKMLDAGVYESSADFIKDSLFCEYAYIANFDDNALEFYVGFQRTAHKKGRYADLDVQVDKQLAQRSRYNDAPTVYYPVAMIGTIPFNLIETDPVAAIAMMDKMEAERRADAEKEEAA